MCTTIIFRYDSGSILGRNMDYEHPVDFNVLYLPRGYHYADDLYGKPLKNKYKMMGICFHDHNPLKDGVNEHGLVGCTNAFKIFNPYYNEVKAGYENISALDFMNYALGNYKSVQELIEDIDNIHISTRDSNGQPVICPSFHHMFVDGSGDSVIIEPISKKLTVVRNPYDVMTNSPSFYRHEKRLKKVMDPDNLDDFNAVKNLPGGYDPTSRFIKAFYLNATHHEAKNSIEALENTYSILEPLKMPRGFVKLRGAHDHTYTRYICAYDVNNKILTARNHTNTSVYTLSFDDIENHDERHSINFEKKLCTYKWSV